MKKIFFIISVFLVAFIAINFVITSSAEDGVEVKENVLRDKTALFVGDSITAGVYDTSENKGFNVFSALLIKHKKETSLKI